MKSTDRFKKVIEAELRYRAFKDPQLAAALEKENKSMDECVTYILNQVKASKREGFEDDEVFSMAMHYYFEDDIKPGGTIPGVNVVINRQIKLSPEEIEQLKEKARQEVINEERAKMRKSKTPKAPSKTESKTQTLFADEGKDNKPKKSN